MAIGKKVLAYGIAIIFAVFIGYGLQTVYPTPKDYQTNNCYTKYNCYDIQRTQQSNEYKACLENQAKCAEDFEKQTLGYKHARNSFFILAFLGIASIIAGLLLSNLDVIGSGLNGGGILIILWSLLSTTTYWYQVSKYMKLIVLAIVLIILLYLGYKKLEKKKQQY